MSRNEQDFEAVRRVLKLKQHEVPPPGYFDNFSREVMARIRAGDTGAPEGIVLQVPWLFRMIRAFEAKPAFAGAFASVLCMVLLAGIVVAGRAPEIATQPILQTASSATSLGIPEANLAVPTPTVETTFVSSTNPVFNAQSVPELYRSTIPAPEAVNVSFFKN